MADVVSPEVRSRMMSGIRGKDTKPEMIVRRGLHAMGFRYKLHDKKLPGKPDLVFPKYKAVIFVHGCFWHKHDCKYFKWPKTRTEFWRRKLLANSVRDQGVVQDLEELGWRVGTIWECAVRDTDPNELISFASNWLCHEFGNLEIGGL
ncbi:very short patch repair endonuclease [Hyphomonas jannaschiana]|uniref:very short patch repair endonuclease n=1 Tax=Hyphomonas jannaschiana TaxID=86 RepID=UPI0035C6FB4B